MRILVLGAGGIGGYFGARLHDAGGDITFLVRPARAAQLRSEGLRVTSPLGDARITPKVVTAADLQGRFDLIIVACKAYDLASAMDAIAPAVGDQSAILPLLNGLAHLEVLDARFGSGNVLGGLAHLAVASPSTGEIRHLNGFHRLVAGTRGADSPHLQSLARLLGATSIEFSISEQIEHDMWGKFVFLATLASATCTMRASIGEILETTAGEDFVVGLLDECEQVAVANGHPQTAAQISAYRAQLTERGSSYTASMLRDIERDGPTEADHILGDMILRGSRCGVVAPLLRLAYSHLQAYESRRRPDALYSDRN
ncbi:2-dehydropantoate 2-reductase [Lysobacter tyrosinilyticus]